MQTAMIANITAIFGLPFKGAFIGTVMSALGGSAGLSMAGRAIAANLLKMVPGAGTVVGGVISASTAAAVTLALGLAYIEALKIYVKDQNDGKEIPLSDLAKLIFELYKYYTRTGEKIVRDDQSLALRQIDIE